MTCITQKMIKPKRVKTPCRLYIVDTPKEDIAMAIKGEYYTLLYCMSVACSSRFTKVDQANLTYAHNTFGVGKGVVLFTFRQLDVRNLMTIKMAM